ncbi:hypothetical protein I5L56_08435 [Pseudomonas oryzihabitans]|uniref:hypothetical protein n=1 Tax=Pseudomonas oryzihabitans TaxID=47885 RepID=UPI0018D6DA4D|nr:hypothetical protein [Pseudomonas oryzihabitans]MBH3329648.1 hypothetical protein [Pseudomonas oryzihabitans]
MDLSNLKTMRKLVPGTTLVLLSIPIYKTFIEESLNSNDALKFPFESYGLVLVFIFGTILCETKLRKKVLEKSLEEISKNIFFKLYGMNNNNQSPPPTLYNTPNKKKMMIIFYHLIDNDESLKEKGKLVRDNGLLWSSTADAIWLGLIFSYLYLILSWVCIFFAPEKSMPLAISGLMIAVTVWALKKIALPRIHREHLKLSNDQLEIINQLHKATAQSILKQNGF